jgi:hypothetical protein
MPNTCDDRALIPGPASAADRGVVGQGAATASVTGVMVLTDASEPVSRSAHQGKTAEARPRPNAQRTSAAGPDHGITGTEDRLLKGEPSTTFVL